MWPNFVQAPGHPSGSTSVPGSLTFSQKPAKASKRPPTHQARMKNGQGMMISSLSCLMAAATSGAKLTPRTRPSLQLCLHAARLSAFSLEIQESGQPSSAAPTKHEKWPADDDQLILAHDGQQLKVGPKSLQAPGPPSGSTSLSSFPAVDWKPAKASNSALQRTKQALQVARG